VHRVALGRPAAATTEEQLHLEVQLVDAHHVPGGAMFVFSGYFGTVVHTGDFRLDPEHVHLGALPMLQDGLTHVYLDNTYCHPAFSQPPRDQVCHEIVQEVVARWPCLVFVAVYQIGKERLLALLARALQTAVLVPRVRAATLEAAGVQEGFAREPCNPEQAPIDQLWRLSLKGCIWAVSSSKLRPTLWRASSHGVAAHGIDPTGWCMLNESNEERQDGVLAYPYSDHSSFLELVQFLSLLPAAPATLLTPLPQKAQRFGYDGLEGLRELIKLSGLAEVHFQEAGRQVAPRAARGGRPNFAVLRGGAAAATTAAAIDARGASGSSSALAAARPAAAVVAAPPRPRGPRFMLDPNAFKLPRSPTVEGTLLPSRVASASHAAATKEEDEAAPRRQTQCQRIPERIDRKLSHVAASGRGQATSGAARTDVRSRSRSRAPQLFAATTKLVLQ